jgi:hypothetical protein
MGNGSLTRVEGKSERKNTPRLQICAARDSQSGNRNLLAVMEALLESGETNRDWQLRTQEKREQQQDLATALARAKEETKSLHRKDRGEDLGSGLQNPRSETEARTKKMKLV